MEELKTWLLNHGFAIIREETLDFGVLLVIQPPTGKNIRVVFPPHAPPNEIINMVRDIYEHRLEKLN